MASPNEIIAASVRDLEKAFNELAIQATKAIRDSTTDSGGAHTAAGSSLASKLDSATSSYHLALDEIESEITKAMSVNLRDLSELRGRRMPAPVAAPATAADPKPVAPQAPMTIEVDSPVATTASPLVRTGAASQTHLPEPAPPHKQESKPPAPVPDMGFDLTVSPEVRPSPSPALSQAKAKQVKPSPKASPVPTVAQTAAITGRPGSAPSKKEPRVAPPSQASRTAGSIPQAPLQGPSAPVAPPAPMMEAPMGLPTSGPPNTATAPLPQAQAAAPPHEMVFTNMAFSVAPAANEATHGGAQVQMQAPAQQQHATDDNTTSSNMPGMAQFEGPADMSGDFSMSGFDPGMLDLNPAVMNNGSNNDNPLGNDTSNNAALGTSDLDADIEKLFASQGPNSADKMDMDYGLGDIDLANNSFDDINWGDDIGEDGDFGADFNASGS